MSEMKVYCNRCGKELDLYDFQQMFYVRTKLQYGSRHDGETIRYRLCSSCIDSIIEESAISPITEVPRND